LLLLIPVLVAVSFLTFAIQSLTPGDPAQMILGLRATAESKEMLHEQLHLDDPFLVRYGLFLRNLMRGDLGNSYHTGLPVTSEILERVPYTLQLTIAASIFALLTGVTLGFVAAASKSRLLDGLVTMGSLAGVSVPDFWLGIMLIILFGVKLGWIPASGGTSLRASIAPAFCLGLSATAVLARVTRSCVLEVLGADYLRTARAKGLRESAVLLRHVLRNSLIPVITVFGLSIGNMMGGAIIIETVFARPGLGRYMIKSVQSRDLPQVQGMVLFMAVVYVLVNLAADILYTYVDPRISYEQ